MHSLQIGVIGSEKCSAYSYKIAVTVGSEIARRNHILVNGGLGGVMEASAKGAQQEGGIVVGILPGDCSIGNSYLTVKIATAMGKGRNALIPLTTDGIIIIEGGSGTLSEICLGYETTPMVAFIKTGGMAKLYANKYIDKRRIQQIKAVYSATEALDVLEKAILRRKLQPKNQ